MYRGLYRNHRGWGRRNPVLYDLPLSYIADPRDLANVNGLGGIYGVPEFLWVAGDGNTPTIGPPMNVTGTPSEDVTPWQLQDGSDVASERHIGTSYRVTTEVIDPEVNEDIVIVLMMQPRINSNDVYFGNRPAGQGWMVYRVGGGTIDLYVAGSTAVSVNFGVPVNSGQHLYVAVIQRGGNITTYVNGIVGTPTACPAGVLGGLNAVGLGARATGSSPAKTSIAFAGFYYGVGIAPNWPQSVVTDFVHRFTGIKPLIGNNSAFTRASAMSWINHNGIWHIGSSGLPRSGDENGFRVAAARTNKCYNTINPQATTGWSTTGGTHTVPSDATQLATDGLSNWGPNIHQFVPGGSDQVIYGGAATTNTNKHSSGTFIRGNAGGESVDVGVRDSSSGVFTNHQTVVLTTSWQRVQIDGWTPGDTDEQFALDCDAGDTVLFIAPQMEEGVVGTSPIPNFATAASATRAQDVLTIPNTPSDSEGSIALFVTPDNWSAADLTGLSPDILSRATVASTILYATTAGYNSDDGTTVITAGSPADGVEDQIRCRWRGTKQSLQVGVPKVSGDYDGSQSGSGSWAIKPTDVEFRIRNLKIYQKGY